MSDIASHVSGVTKKHPQKQHAKDFIGLSDSGLKYIFPVLDSNHAFINTLDFTSFTEPDLRRKLQNAYEHFSRENNNSSESLKTRKQKLLGNILRPYIRGDSIRKSDIRHLLPLLQMTLLSKMEFLEYKENLLCESELQRTRYRYSVTFQELQPFLFKHYSEQDLYNYWYLQENGYRFRYFEWVKSDALYLQENLPKNASINEMIRNPTIQYVTDQTPKCYYYSSKDIEMAIEKAGLHVTVPDKIHKKQFLIQQLSKWSQEVGIVPENKSDNGNNNKEDRIMPIMNDRSILTISKTTFLPLSKLIGKLMPEPQYKPIIFEENIGRQTIQEMENLLQENITQFEKVSSSAIDAYLNEDTKDEQNNSEDLYNGVCQDRDVLTLEEPETLNRLPIHTRNDPVTNRTFKISDLIVFYINGNQTSYCLNRKELFRYWRDNSGSCLGNCIFYGDYAEFPETRDCRVFYRVPIPQLFISEATKAKIEQYPEVLKWNLVKKDNIHVVMGTRGHIISEYNNKKEYIYQAVPVFK